MRIVSTSILIISFVINIQLANASLRCLAGFRKIISGEEAIKKDYDQYRRYRKYLRPDTYAFYKQKLYSTIERWSQVAQRDLRLSELKRTRARSLVQESMHLDRPQIVADQLKPLFYRVQMSFYAIKRNTRITKKIRHIKAVIEKTNTLQIESYIKNIEVNENYHLSFRHNLKKMKPKDFIFQLKLELIKIENDSIKHTVDMARNFEEYSSSINTLKSYLKNSGPLKIKAQEVLKLLKGRKLVEFFLEMSGNKAKFETATVEEVLKEINSNPIAQIISLEKELSQERWTSIVSRMTNTQLNEVTDLLIKRVPWLNNETIRSHIRYTIDNKEVLSHYPNIDRLVSNGKKDTVIMWDYLLSLEARDRGSNSFLTTFARRVDTRESWRELKLFGKKRAEELKSQGHPLDLEVKLYEKMILTEKEIQHLPSLAPWHHPTDAKAIRFLIDGIILSAFIGSSYYIVSDIFDRVFEEENSKEENSTSQEGSENEIDLTSTLEENLGDNVLDESHLDTAPIFSEMPELGVRSESLPEDVLLRIVFEKYPELDQTN